MRNLNKKLGWSFSEIMSNRIGNFIFSLDNNRLFDTSLPMVQIQEFVWEYSGVHNFYSSKKYYNGKFSKE